MKLKLDDQGHAVLKDGHPVYVYDDGKEAPFDAPAAAAAIKARNAEAKSHRERAEAAEAKLQAFGDIDPEAARAAVDTVSKIDQAKLVDAGKVDQVRAELDKAWSKKYAAVEQQTATLQQQLHREIVGGNFARSKFIAERMLLPADLAERAFGDRFTVKDGKLLATDSEGNPIFSRARPGEPADFEEAIAALVESYPNRDAILRGSQASGSGAPSSGTSGGGKTWTRAQFDAASHPQRAAFAKEGGTVTD